MRILAKIAMVIVMMTMLPGCAAVAVGGLIYHDSKSRDQREAFNQHFNQNNLERAKVGLPPLDYCTEARRSDQTWAADLPECKAGAAAIPAGSIPATEPPTPPAPSPVPAASGTVECITEGGQKLQVVGTECPAPFRRAS